MKITLNLSSAPSSHEQYALAWAVPLALIALVSMGFLVSSSLTSWRNYRKYQSALVEADNQDARLRQRQLTLERELGRPELDAIYRDTQFINSLIERRQFSVAELTQRVTRLMPTSVHLVGLALSHHEHERVLRFTVAGEKQEDIETFLVNLENSPTFDQVQITNQGEEQTEAGGRLVVLMCSARFAGPESAQETSR